MARQEEDREDLVRQATALVRRGEFLVEGDTEPTFAGFRPGGAASFFFGSDLVVHFNQAGQLRRGFDHGRLLKAEKGQLISFSRVRDPTAVHLVRQPLDGSQTRAWLEKVDARLACFERALREHAARCTVEVPPQGNLSGELIAWLARRGPLRIAPRPHVG